MGLIYAQDGATILCGSISRDPDFHARDKQSFTILSVKYKTYPPDESGKYAGEYMNVICSGKKAYQTKGLKKGESVFIMGTMEDHEYTDGEGVLKSRRQVKADFITKSYMPYFEDKDNE
jgi:single-stranded DNA-binding protein